MDDNLDEGFGVWHIKGIENGLTETDGHPDFVSPYFVVTLDYTLLKMQHLDFVPQGVCCRCMHIDVDDGKVENVTFEGGCNGNLKGIAALVKGMPVDEVVKRLRGIRCGMKLTSCPDQLAAALERIG